MLRVLRNPTYAKLFGAQIIALIGTGLLTVALGLLAFDIAGGDAGVVMGVAMSIKMIAYVVVSPVMIALVARLPKRPVLIAADLVRAGTAVALPFVTEVWQIYVLIFILQSASATFTPTFQAVIPSILPDEGEYTRALSLSRLAYDLESVVSPMLAAALLTVISYNNLFVGTVVGFVVSAILVTAARLPAIDAPAEAPFLDRLTGDTRLFWRERELRGLMALNLVVATTTAMVVVNTVVLVQGLLGRSQTDVALMLAMYGAGSMVVALAVPSLLDRISDHPVMLTGGMALPVLLASAAGVIAWTDGTVRWAGLLILWFLIGSATSAVLTPSARLLRRNSTEATRPAVFASQFSLSHLCFLVTYPVAGTLGAALGLGAVALVLTVLGAVGAVVAAATWLRGEKPGVDDDDTVAPATLVG